MSINFTECSGVSCKEYKRYLEVVKYGDVDDIREMCNVIGKISNNASRLMNDLYNRLIDILGDVGSIFNIIATYGAKRDLYMYFGSNRIPYEVVKYLRLAVVMNYKLIYCRYSNDVEMYVRVSELSKSDVGGYFSKFKNIGDCSESSEVYELRLKEEELREKFLIYLIGGDYLKAYYMIDND